MWAGGGCFGGWIEPALQYVVDAGGVLQEEEYPYAGQNTYCKVPKGVGERSGGEGEGAGRVAGGRPGPVASAFEGYLQVPSKDEGALMEALHLHGPISVLMDVMMPFRFYSEGVFSNANCSMDPDDMDHAILLVGYGTTNTGVDFWIIQNSWSKMWGMDGYARISRKGSDCGISLDPVIAVVNPQAAAQARARASAAAAR